MRDCENCKAPFRPIGGGSRYCPLCKGSSRENRARVDALKSAPCSDCGIAWPPCVMQFDHNPGSVKVGGVSRLVNGPWFLVEAEIAKCQLVCSNCHLKRTFSRGFGKRTSLAGQRPARPVSSYWWKRAAKQA